MSIKEKKLASISASILAGAAAGVLLGIIYAPEKGSITRKKIKTKANNLKDDVKNNYIDFSVKIKEQYDAISTTLNNVKDNYDEYKDNLVSTTTEIIKDVETKLNELK